MGRPGYSYGGQGTTKRQATISDDDDEFDFTESKSKQPRNEISTQQSRTQHNMAASKGMWNTDLFLQIQLPSGFLD